MSANGIDWISAAENPVSAARRFAADLITLGLKPVVVVHAKIAGLQAVKINQL